MCPSFCLYMCLVQLWSRSAYIFCSLALTQVSSFSNPGCSRGPTAAWTGTGPSSSCPSPALLWGQFCCRWPVSLPASSFPWCTTFRTQRTLTARYQTTCRQLVQPSVVYQNVTSGAAALGCTRHHATWCLSPTLAFTVDALPGGCRSSCWAYWLCSPAWLKTQDSCCSRTSRPLKHTVSTVWLMMLLLLYTLWKADLVFQKLTCFKHISCVPLDLDLRKTWIALLKTLIVIKSLKFRKKPLKFCKKKTFHECFFGGYR